MSYMSNYNELKPFFITSKDKYSSLGAYSIEKIDTHNTPLEVQKCIINITSIHSNYALYEYIIMNNKTANYVGIHKLLFSKNDFHNSKKLDVDMSKLVNAKRGKFIREQFAEYFI